jgi:hypothetical protein
MADTLPKGQELSFLLDYMSYAQKLGLAMDPDDPLHFYDYRKAWMNGGLNPDDAGHLSSAYKLPGNPRYYMSPDQKQFSEKPVKGWLNTVTGKPVK